MRKVVVGTVTGTSGVLIRAKLEGYVDELKPILCQMSQNGIYMSKNIVELCLRQAGEMY